MRLAGQETVTSARNAADYKTSAKRRCPTSPSHSPQHAGRWPAAWSAVRLPPGECGIWWADPAAARPELAAILSGAERERWGRFRFDHDRAAYLAAHALTRIVAGGLLGIAPQDVGFETVCANCGGAHGKPRLPGGALEFSITHSRGRVGVAFARHVPVGIDVEDVTAARLSVALAPTALAPAEQAALASLPDNRRGHGFLRYWTRKEAVLKATGYGLSIRPDLLTVTAPGDSPALLAWTARPALTMPAYLHDLDPGPAQVAALAFLGGRPKITEHHASWILAT
jgi:4'-phosphopantetheinyl transferase